MSAVEWRSVPNVALEVRGTAATLSGYAAVFNSLSRDLGGFREIVLPGTFDRTLREQPDVIALVNHDTNQALARTPHTLKLRVDARGLRAEIDPGDTQVGRDAVTNVKRGVLNGMSFAFTTAKDDWRIEGNEVIRELRDVSLVDVSVVALPAYPATQISARCFEAVSRISGACYSRDVLNRMALLLGRRGA